MKKAVLICLAVILAASCRKAYFPEEAEMDTMVVEGWIDSGMPPIVFVSTPVKAVDNLRASTSLSDVNLRHAKVTIECDGQTYPLTCRYSEAYFLRFYFTTSELIGEVGRSYHLRVEYLDDVAEAVATITPPKEIDKLTVVRAENEPDSYSIQAYLHNDTSKREYFKFFVWNTTEDSSYASSFSETFSNEGAAEEVCVTVKGSTRLTTEGAEVNFHKGDTVKVKLATMNSEAFEFWKGFDQNSTCLRFPIISVFRNCQGNVNGALGYWIGYGTNEYTVCVE